AAVSSDGACHPLVTPALVAVETLAPRNRSPVPGWGGAEGRPTYRWQDRPCGFASGQPQPLFLRLRLGGLPPPPRPPPPPAGGLARGRGGASQQSARAHVELRTMPGACHR